MTETSTYINNKLVPFSTDRLNLHNSLIVIYLITYIIIKSGSRLQMQSPSEDQVHSNLIYSQEKNTISRQTLKLTNTHTSIFYTLLLIRVHTTQMYILSFVQFSPCDHEDEHTDTEMFKERKKERKKGFLCLFVFVFFRFVFGWFFFCFF